MTDQKLETVLELALSTDEAQREQSNTLDVGYDPATKRWELIVKYSGSPVFPDFVTFFPLFGGYAIVSVPENYIPTLSEMPEIEYIEKPKNLVLSLYEARAASCITPVQNPPLSLDGSGVLVGIVDSGIDVFHPDFRNEDGTTRIRELWDQTVPNETESFFNRGRIFTSEDINRALAENDRSFPSRDLSGHGTHVAGIAAGNGRASQGRTTICIGSGNEGNKGRHTSGTLNAAQTTQIELAVAPSETSLNLQIWKNYVDTFRIRLLAPSGNDIFLTARSPGVHNDILDSTQLLWYLGEPSPYSTSQEIYLEMLPIPGNTYIQGGIWKFQLIPENIVDGSYNLWLPSGNSINPDTRFLVPIENTTLTIPSTASAPISVAAYNSNTDTFAPFSGQGYTGLSLAKPDIAAPGVDILSTAPGGGYTRNTGTSMATPFVTGSAALLMQYGIVQNRDPYLYGQKVKAYLQRGARHIPAEKNYPSPMIGWGALCLKDSLPG